MIHPLKFVGTGLASFTILAAKSAPCPSDEVALTVSSAVDLEALTTAMNCSGEGNVHVTWSNFIQVSQPIQISDRKILTINGTDVAAIIDAGNITDIFTVSDESTLVLSGVVLKGGNSDRGGAVSVSGSSALYVVDCGFTDNFARQGGAIFATGSNVSVGSNTYFANNSAVGGEYAGGGAIFAGDGSELHVDGAVSFTENTAINGGALKIQIASVHIDGETNFKRNSADVEGGAIHAYKSDVCVGGRRSMIDSTTIVFGGCIRSVETEGYFPGSPTFNNNWAGGGGAIVSADSNVHVDCHTTFTSNYAVTDKGGALLAYWSNISVDGGTAFVNNTAFDGGAINVYNSETIIVGSTWFASNSVNKNGGALRVVSGKAYVGENASFCNNWAGEYGGAIWTFLADVHIEGNAYLFNNSANGTGYGGGGLMAHGSNVSIGCNTSFVQNAAQLGASGQAVFTGVVLSSPRYRAICGSGTKMDIDGGTAFMNNAAYESGGAITAVYQTEVNIGGNATFTNNVAYSRGGSIRVQNNSALHIVGNTCFSGNSAKNGGAISGFAGILTVNGNPTFTHNVATTDGGGVHSVQAERILFKGGPGFLENMAGRRGGAVSIREPGEFNISGGTFKRNSANDGGAVYLSAFQDTQRALTACYFEYNTASDGGALFIETGGGLDTITSSNFSCNFAETSGGAIYHVGHLHVSHAVFSENKAGEEGFAITNLGSTDVDLKSVTLIDNTKHCPAEEYGYEEKEDKANTTRFEMVCARCLTDGEVTGSRVDVRSNGTTPVCEELPEGVLQKRSGTTVATLYLEKGYYRTSNRTTQVVECHHYDACGGGEDFEQYCTAGYEGPYCAACSEGYAPAGTYTCHKCSDVDVRLAVVFAVVMAVLVVVLVAALIVHLVKVIDNHPVEGRTLEERRPIGKNCGHLRGMFMQVFPLTAVKTVVVVWQIISQFAAIAGDIYPEEYAAFISKISVINLNIGFMLSYSCILVTDFYDRLLFATIFPLLVFAVLISTYFIAKARNNSSEGSMRKVRHKHLSAALFFAFFIYSSVSFTIFQTFVCDSSLDDGPFLRADYSLTCDSDVYKKYRAYAIAMVCVYPIGVPTVFAWWLASNRVELAGPDRDMASHLQPLSGIWAAYRPSRYYYEVVECGRRIALTAAAVFVLPNTISQVAAVLLLAAVFLFLSESLSPFSKSVDMRLYRWGNGVIMASMYVALLLKVNVAKEGLFSLSAFGKVLIFANVFMVVTVIIQSLNMLQGVASSVSPIEASTPVRERYTGQIFPDTVVGSPVLCTNDVNNTPLDLISPGPDPV